MSSLHCDGALLFATLKTHTFPLFSLRTKELCLIRRLHSRPHVLYNTILQRPAPTLANPNIVTLVIEPERLLNVVQCRGVPM
jgi:hypothetical protein